MFWALLCWEIGEVSGESTFFKTLIAYNKACTLARLGKEKKALQALQEAVDKGFNNLSILETDKDLDSLRQLPGFSDIIQQIKK